jgi:hypothetical protein
LHQKRVTIYDIADKVGVSQTTVALALRNHPRISESRRKQIKRVAADPLVSKTKDSLLDHLSSGKYLNFDETSPGILQEAQVGADTPGSAQNAYTSWGIII